MIMHTVTFRWKPEMPEGQVEQIVAALTRLNGQVPGMRWIRCGEHVGGSSGAFDFAVVAEFDDLSAFSAYGSHPAHRTVADECIIPWLADLGSVQFDG